MGEVVKLLPPLPSTGSDCPYALVWFNRDTCHALLPKEGQLSVQVMGGTGSTTCRRVSQLQGLPTPQLHFPGSLSSRMQWV